MALTVGSLFAGIGGFDLGFERAGFRVRWQVEQDGKAQSVLSRRFADADLFDDVCASGRVPYRHWLEPVDVLCGGFPCQDVSVAGKREGLGGARTGLFWQVVRIVRALQPHGLTWVVLENVPGLLSSHGGRDFHAVLAALADCGFRRAYRILDSRYFGVAQRRRRVFLVLRARGSGDSPAPVLFESARGGGDSPAGNEARPHVAATLRGRSHGAGVNAPGRGGEDDQNLVTAFDWQTQGSSRTRPHCGNGYTSALEAGKRDALMIAGPLGGGNDGIGRRSEDDPNLVLGVHANQRGELRTSSLAGSLNGSRSGKQYEGVGIDLSHALTSSHTRSGRYDPNGETYAIAATLNSGGNDGGFRTEPGEHLTAAPMGVRRLTPLECERLQGFPDGWTCLCGAGWQGSIFCECADSPRYKQLGNAVTVNVAQWIAERIKQAEAGEAERQQESR